MGWYILWFGFGFLFGLTIGVVLMCCLSVSKVNQYNKELDDFIRETEKNKEEEGDNL